MSSSLFQPKYLHDVSFHDQKSGNDVKFGPFATLHDCKRGVSPKLLIVDDINIELTYPDFDRERCESFYLLSHRKHGQENNPSESQSRDRFIQYLSNNPHKAGRVYLDSARTVGLLVPLTQTDSIFLGSSRKGFRCLVVSESDTSTISKKRDFEQLQAADHYNDLVRDIVSRHILQTIN